MGDSEIAAFYSGRTLLITGASGFMGKVLIWKLLKSCPSLRRIYVLIRVKRGKSVETRLEELVNTPIFAKYWQGDPALLKKIVAIAGDVACENLGLNDDSKKVLIEEVNVVFHVAATLKLDATLKDAVNMNAEGTLRLLQLCQQMKNLQAFVHTSTAFCHCDYEILEERVYPPPEDPHNLINLCKWMDKSTLDSITEKILHPHPNTYTYSKRLAEKLVADHYPQLPVAIARPSIVIPAWKEPVPGWVDTLNGPVGLMIGAGKGVIRTMLCNPQYHAEVIPVDMAINGLIATAWKVATMKERPPEIPVYNLTQNDQNPMTWGEVVESGKKIAHEYPFEMTLWYPGGNIRSNWLVHNIVVLFCHWLPAYFIDFLMLCFGQKRFMVRIQQRIHEGLRLLQYFTLHEWCFKNRRVIQLANSMNETDKQIFYLCLEKIDPKNYMIDCILGARHYCLKENPESLPRCRRNLKILYVVDRLATVLFYVFIAWLTLRLFGKIFDLSSVRNSAPLSYQSIDKLGGLSSGLS